MDLDTARDKCYQADRLLQQAQKSVTAQERKQLILSACALYQEVLDDESVELPDPYIGLAYLIFSSGNKAQALELLETAVALSSPVESRAGLVLNQLKQTPAPQLASLSGTLEQKAVRPVLKEIAENLEAVVFKMPDF